MNTLFSAQVILRSETNDEHGDGRRGMTLDVPAQGVAFGGDHSGQIDCSRDQSSAWFVGIGGHTRVMT
jgi:hypothetical protein